MSLRLHPEMLTHACSSTHTHTYIHTQKKEFVFSTNLMIFSPPAKTFNLHNLERLFTQTISYHNYLVFFSAFSIWQTWEATKTKSRFNTVFERFVKYMKLSSLNRHISKYTTSTFRYRYTFRSKDPTQCIPADKFFRAQKCLIGSCR